MKTNKSKFQSAIDSIDLGYRLADEELIREALSIAAEMPVIHCELNARAMDLLDQICRSNYVDEKQHPLKNNAAYKRLAEIVGK